DPSTVSLTYPAPNQTVFTNAPIQVIAAATPGSGRTITKISFYVDDTFVSECSSCIFVWTSSVLGGHSLKVKATDSAGFVASSAPVPVTVSPPLQPQSQFNELSARLNALNRTGGSGEDLFSGNFNWSLPLVGLRGRAGLDLGLSLTYNS